MYQSPRQDAALPEVLPARPLIPMNEWLDALCAAVKTGGLQVADWSSAAARTALEAELARQPNAGFLELSVDGFRRLLATDDGNVVRRVVMGEIIKTAVDAVPPSTPAQALIQQSIYAQIAEYQFDKFGKSENVYSAAGLKSLSNVPSAL